MQSFWYAVHQLLQGLVVSQRALHLGIIQSRCKKSQKELCAKELCANANVFDFKKIGQNCCQLHASGGDR